MRVRRISSVRVWARTARGMSEAPEWWVWVVERLRMRGRTTRELRVMGERVAAMRSGGVRVGSLLVRVEESTQSNIA